MQISISGVCKDNEVMEAVFVYMKDLCLLNVKLNMEENCSSISMDFLRSSILSLKMMMSSAKAKVFVVMFCKLFGIRFFIVFWKFNSIP